MARYSEDIVEEVRSRSDIVDIISGYVKLTKKGSTYFGLCPFHNEKTGSFSVSPAKQMYYCFGCGAGGNVFTFLMQYENFTFPEAVQTLAERTGVELPKREQSPREKQEADRRAQLFEVNREAAKYYYTLLRSENGGQALSYFRKRALTDETMKKFGLGYSDKYRDDLYRYLRKKGYPDELLRESGLISYDEKSGAHDKFWNRAMFPIMDIHSKVIGFGGRVMGEGEPKYLNSPETRIFDKSRNLYGLHLARHSKKPQILLCEGYMDVIALHQAGFDNAVASLGTAFTAGHAGLLRRYTKEVYLTFDSDGAGIHAALRAIPMLREVGLTARVIDMRPHKDPDEFIKALGAEEYQKRIDAAENSFLFEIRILEQEFDMKDPDGRTKFANEAARKLLTFTEELERNNYIDAVAQKYGMGYENLRKLVDHYGTQGGLVRERTPLKSGRSEKKHQKEDGIHLAQRLLLTWMAENEALYDSLKDILTPEDFTGAVFQKTAALLYEQLKRHAVNPAQIIDQFEDEDQQREVAELFHARLQEFDSPEAWEKAVRQNLTKVKKKSMEAQSGRMPPGDMTDTQRLLNERRALDQIEKMHIPTNKCK
ncbi:MAG: DNA primase [Lachnospiraceae bacterium]|nr:DNA primase [Lachnospiraceae bacterium]